MREPAYVRKLRRLGACAESVEWAAAYPTLEAAWAACEVPDWMLWLIGATDAKSPDSHGRRLLALIAAQCADAVPQEGAGRVAVDLAFRWGAGDPAVTQEMLAAARDAAWAASDAASAASAASAAASAASAASAAAWAARDAASYAAWAARANQCALIRELYPVPPVL